VIPSLVVSEFVKLCHCQSLEAAQEARALLEAEGISVRIDGEHASAVFGGSTALLDMRIWVPEDQLEQALRIIDEHGGSEPDDVEDDADEEESERDESERDESEREESSGGDDERTKPDEQMPERYPSWMRRGRKWTGLGLALAGLTELVRGGDPMRAAFLFVFAVLVFGITQSSDE
jgi:hypothetical protein